MPSELERNYYRLMDDLQCRVKICEQTIELFQEQGMAADSIKFQERAMVRYKKRMTRLQKQYEEVKTKGN